jgi:hypothetical protein
MNMEPHEPHSKLLDEVIDAAQGANEHAEDAKMAYLVALETGIRFHQQAPEIAERCASEMERHWGWEAHSGANDPEIPLFIAAGRLDA